MGTADEEAAAKQTTHSHSHSEKSKEQQAAGSGLGHVINGAVNTLTRVPAVASKTAQAGAHAAALAWEEPDRTLEATRTAMEAAKEAAGE